MYDMHYAYIGVLLPVVLLVPHLRMKDSQLYGGVRCECFSRPAYLVLVVSLARRSCSMGTRISHLIFQMNLFY